MSDEFYRLPTKLEWQKVEVSLEVHHERSRTPFSVFAVVQSYRDEPFRFVWDDVDQCKEFASAAEAKAYIEEWYRERLSSALSPVDDEGAVEAIHAAVAQHLDANASYTGWEEFKSELRAIIKGKREDQGATG